MKDSPEQQAKALYKSLFFVPWPKRWNLRFAASGATFDYRMDKVLDGAVVLMYMNLKEAGALSTLIHEFVHIQLPLLGHGTVFNGVVRALSRRVERA